MLNGAVPAFDLAAGGLLLPAVRALAVAALFQAFGALVFLRTVMPRAFAKSPPDVTAAVDRTILRLTMGSLLVGAAALIGWLFIESGVIADAATLSEFFAAVPKVTGETSFGHTVVLQLGCLGATGLALALRRPTVATLLAALATLLQAGHSHAFSMSDDEFPLISDVLHLLGGAVWLGGLVPLLLAIRKAPAAAGAASCRWFSPIGKIALGAVAVSAAYQGYLMAGGFVGLVGTAYGWVELVKLLLLAALTIFALLNRYRFAPALCGADPAAARRTVLRSIALQTGAGVLVMLAASLLSSLPPGMHLEPVWPFTQQFSLAAIEEDADFRREVVGAVLALAGAVLLLAAGIAVRRLRWPAVAAALVIAWFAIPHLDLLLAEAYPTSFYHSTTGFAADSIAVGGRLYPENCQSCHGEAGKGDGPTAKTLSVPPADLTAGHLWGHSDGQLFWWLSHGIEGPEGDALVMPGFATTLSEDERWNLIDFIRARNAGGAYAASGNWPVPLAAPGFTATCPAGGTSLASLHGKVVRIAFVGPGGTKLPPVPADAGVEVVTVIVPLAGYVPPPGCAATDPAIAESYGLVAGVAPNALAGTQFLVDPDGWLRAMQRPGETIAAGWDDPAALLAEINQICRHPLAVSGGADAHHHHAE